MPLIDNFKDPKYTRLDWCRDYSEKYGPALQELSDFEPSAALPTRQSIQLTTSQGFADTVRKRGLEKKGLSKALTKAFRSAVSLLPNVLYNHFVKAHYTNADICLKDVIQTARGDLIANQKTSPYLELSEFASLSDASEELSQLIRSDYLYRRPS